MATIGVLALQGDFAEHQRMLESAGSTTVLVKHARQLDSVDGLVIPGGESTTIAKLTGTSGDGIFEAITNRARQGMPLYGTCMGTIFLAKEIENSTQGRLALMDICVKRNAFGAQKFSREEDVAIPCLGEKPFNVIFIRGPIITRCGTGVIEQARVSEGIVMARQDNLLATAFHPELTDDCRVHQYFVSMVEDWLQSRGSAATAYGNSSQLAAAGF